MKAANDSLLKIITAGTQKKMADEELAKIIIHVAEGRLLQEEMDRHAPNESKGWMELVNRFLNNVAIHEGAHVLHDAAGIIGSGGRHKEEERAYLTEMAFGHPRFVLAFLPRKDNGDPNNQAGSEITKRIISNNDAGKIFLATDKEIAAIGSELLDDEFMKSFGKHHDQVIPTIELYRIKKHNFFLEKDLPMFDNLKPIDEEKKDVKEKKAA